MLYDQIHLFYGIDALYNIKVLVILLIGAYSSFFRSFVGFFSSCFMLLVQSYFLNWFMNSEEAKVLHVGAEWMSTPCMSVIMGLQLLQRCCNIKP